jgi:PPOX class probable FMN-dependent enzyme
MGRIEDQQALRELYAAPAARALAKAIPELDAHCIRFIGLSPFCVIGSASATGKPDLSPRGGAPGFAKVEDSAILLPDRPGNNRLDMLSKLAANPRIALLFMVPGMDETLRVFGNAEIVSGDDFGTDFVTNNRAPQTVLKITVDQVFFQCGKALMRAQLWSEESKCDRSAMPTMGEIMRDHIGHTDHVETQDEMVSRYRKQLYSRCERLSLAAQAALGAHGGPRSNRQAESAIDRKSRSTG